MMQALRKRVLMFCYYYPPANNGGVERSVKFAKYLPEFGWEPIVVTTSLQGSATNANVERIIFTSELLKLYRQAFNKEVREARQKRTAFSVHATTAPNRGFIRSIVDLVHKWLAIPDLQTGWAVFAFWPAWSLLREGEIDAIYTTSPPVSSHLLGLVLKKLTGKPWVMDLRDPWTFEPLNRYLREPGYRLSVETRLERLCFNHADAIIVNTPEATRRYKVLYPEYAGKMQTITNGFDSEELARAAAALDQPSPWQGFDDDTFVISHIGAFSRNISKDTDPTPYALFDALKKLLGERIISPGKHRVIFAGDLDPKTVDRISELGLDSLVEVPGTISHFDAMRLMLRSDLLLLFDPEEDGKTYVRGKLYEYLGSGKQILGVVPDGASRNLLRRSGHELLAFPNDTEGIRQALMKALRQYGTVAVSYSPVMDYERKRLTGHLADKLDDLSTSVDT